MTVQDLIEVIGGEVHTSFKNVSIKNFKTDTRKLEKGDAYIAIIGKKLDGHDFIQEAALKKAAVIVACKNIDVNIKTPIIYVNDTIDALALLGKYFREKYHPFLIAITGSAGKTTTKELLYTVLSSKYSVLKGEKNYNNSIGVPLSLFQLNETHDIALIEMGMNHKGEIENLSLMATPNLCVITSIGTSHIGYLKSRKNIFKAKMEIVKGMEDGILVVNGDDTYLRKVKNTSSFDVIKCGKNSTYHLKPYCIEENLENLSFKIKYHNIEYKISVPVIGKHLIIDILIAIEVGLLFNIKIEDIITSLKAYHTSNRRMNIIYKNQFKVIDDCYNASYESCKGICEFLKHRKENKILIIGDMLELGSFSQRFHLKLGKELIKIKNSEILLIGDETKVIKGRNIKHFESHKEIISYLKSIDKTGKLIVLKGGRGMHLETILDAL